MEIFAEELRLAGRALGELLGETDAEDLLGIIFSLPGRFREQREHMERQKREITDKLYAMQKTQDELLRLVEALQKNDAAAPRDPQND